MAIQYSTTHRSNCMTDIVTQAIATVRQQQQITVSPTAPANPQINDLWLQTN